MDLETQVRRALGELHRICAVPQWQLRVAQRRLRDECATRGRTPNSHVRTFFCSFPQRVEEIELVQLAQVDVIC